MAYRTPWYGSIERQTEDNRDFRRVLFTGPHEQLVLMNLGPGEEIGLEAHRDVDQFLRIERGSGTFTFGASAQRTRSVPVRAGDAMLVPAGTWHNVRNTGPTSLALYTVYSSPEHGPGLVERVRPLTGHGGEMIGHPV